MNIIGKVKVFKNEKEGNVWYSASLSNKLENGTYDYLPILVKFKSGKEKEGVLDVNNGFLTFYRDKNQNPRLKLVIMDYVEGNIEDISDLPF